MADYSDFLEPVEGEHAAAVAADLDAFGVDGGVDLLGGAPASSDSAAAATQQQQQQQPPQQRAPQTLEEARAALEQLKTKYFQELNQFEREKADFEAEMKESKLDFKLFYGNVNIGTTETYIRELFSQYGDVKEAILLRDPEGASRRSGFVRFYSKSAADTAVASLHDRHMIPGETRPMIVRYANQPKTAVAGQQQQPQQHQHQQQHQHHQQQQQPYFQQQSYQQQQPYPQQYQQPYQLQPPQLSLPQQVAAAAAPAAAPAAASSGPFSLQFGPGGMPTAITTTGGQAAPIVNIGGVTYTLLQTPAGLVYAPLQGQGQGQGAAGAGAPRM